MALGEIISRLSVELSLNSAAFEKNARKSGASAADLGNRMEKMGNRVGTAVRGIAAAGVAIAGSAIVSSIKDMAIAGLDHASALGEEAVQLGVTTSALQRYRFIATQVGIDQAVMDKGLARLTMTLGDLKNGAKGPTEAMGRLGLSAAEVARVAGMNAEQALPFLADKFKALGSDTERAAAAADIFGAKMGSKFLTLLAEGSAGINRMADAYKRLGIEISPEQIAAADKARDEMAANELAIQNKLAQISAKHAPEIAKASMAWGQLKIDALRIAGETVGKLSQFNIDYYTKYVAWANSLGKVNLTGGLTKSYGEYVAWAERVRAVAMAVPGYLRNMVAGIAAAVGGQLTAVWDRAKAAVESVRGAFFNLWDKVTRRSYIPDMVDEIATQIARLDGVMVDKTSKTTKATTEAFKKMADQVRPILDKLFPEAAALRAYQDELSGIDKAEKGKIISPAAAAEARRRAAFATSPGEAEKGIEVWTPQTTEELERALEGVVEKTIWAKDKLKDGTVRIAKSFKDMAQDTMSSLQNLTGAIKSGGFLNILKSVIGFGLQLGSVGVFGKKMQTRLNATPRALGGPISAGKPYLVGERGMELVIPNHNGSVIPNSRLQGGITNNYYTMPSDEFWGTVNAGHGRAAQMGAKGGAMIANAQRARSSKWALA